MTCSHCEKAVADGLSQVPGIGEITADAASGRVGFRLLGPVQRQDIEDVLTEAGFTLGVWPDRNP
ncbi:heavy-metal-associated domain-containing protein [Arthrobacter sp. Leaf141]|uniref:heavy-metal-associated domain-containing protein n=1 Tax=Arthrobacter sp. Leaf141 TaxID=1736273 RepID=UPI003FA4A830